MAGSLGGRGRLTATAKLLADGGAAAEQEEFFRCREFLGAERATHTLLVQGEGPRIAIPLLVREIPGTSLRDAISPYGYPGAAMLGRGRQRGAAVGPPRLSAADVDWSGAELVSVFVRDRLGVPPVLAGATERSRVQVSDPALPRKSRMSDRQQIRRNERDGYAIECVPGPEAGAAGAAELHRVYVETMRRAGAERGYLFAPDYFAALLGSPRSWLLRIARPGAETAAAAIAVLSDGVVHYYLSGTADADRDASPSKNLIVAAIELAESLGLPMNLGGGIRPGDALEAFKRGFANRELPFHTHEIVCDPEAYGRLVGDREAGAFFPAYRAVA